MKSKIVQTAKEIETIIFIEQDLFNKQDKIDEIESYGVEIIPVSFNRILSNSRKLLDLKEILSILYEKQFYSVMIEAGSKICSSFFWEKLVDKIYYFIAPKIVGGNFSLFRELKINKMDEAIKTRIESIERIGEDILLIGYLDF